MAVRIFGLAKTGTRKTWVSASHATPGAFEQRLLQIDSGRRLIAWMVCDPCPPPPTTDQEFFDQTLALIQAGQHCPPSARAALVLLNDWASSVALSVPFAATSDALEMW